MTEIDLSWYKPFANRNGDPVTETFIRSSAEEAFIAGGVGSGKSVASAVKAMLACVRHPGTQGYVARQTMGTLRATAMKVLLDGDELPPVIPPETIKRRWSEDGGENVELVNGSEILFRSYQDWNPEKLLSLNLGWVWLEEASEATENIWNALMGRLRRSTGPRQAWGSTNPNGHDWIWRRSHPDAGQCIAERYEVNTLDNPHLPPDFLQRMLSMPKEWQKRYVFGSCDQAAGQIWDTWRSDIHTYDPKRAALPPEWRQFASLDHGTRNPTCVLWCRTDRDGNVWVEDEYYEPGIVSTHAQAILAKRPETKSLVLKADPSVFSQGPDGVSVADIYAKAGIRLRRAVNDVSAGLLRVSEYLQPDPAKPFPHEHPRAGEAGAPAVFVSRRCANLIREIPDYRWKDLSASVERNRDQPEEPRKKDDHAADSFRYALADLPRPTRVVDTAALLEREKRAPERRTNSAGLLTARF